MPRSVGIGRTGGKQKRARFAAAPEAAAKRQMAASAAVDAAIARAEAALQTEDSQTNAEVRCWLDGVLARLEPVDAPRPPALEQHEFSGYGKTEEEALLSLAAKNNLCTCAQGVPSFYVACASAGHLR